MEAITACIDELNKEARPSLLHTYHVRGVLVLGHNVVVVAGGSRLCTGSRSSCCSCFAGPPCHCRPLLGRGLLLVGKHLWSSCPIHSCHCHSPAHWTRDRLQGWGRGWVANHPSSQGPASVEAGCMGSWRKRETGKEEVGEVQGQGQWPVVLGAVGPLVQVEEVCVIGWRSQRVVWPNQGCPGCSLQMDVSAIGCLPECCQEVQRSFSEECKWRIHHKEMWAVLGTVLAH